MCLNLVNLAPACAHARATADYVTCHSHGSLNSFSPPFITQSSSRPRLSNMSPKYDVVIYGASGYTGQYVVEFLIKSLKKAENSDLTWAVAGRNEAKLLQVLKNASETTKTEVEKTPIIICDSNDVESMLAMARSARLVVNCVGPYRFYGEQTVKACVEAGTHHVDISGNPSI